MELSEGRRQQPARAAKVPAAAQETSAAADRDAQRARAPAELIALAQSRTAIGTPEGPLVSSRPGSNACTCAAVARVPTSPCLPTVAAASVVQFMGTGQSDGCCNFIPKALKVYTRKQKATKNAGKKGAAANEAPRVRVR